jgi:hypothetical protein
MWAETNSGIAVVVPAWRLRRLIDEEQLMKDRELEERRFHN